MRQSLFHLCVRFGVLIGLLLGLVPKLEAKPDFSASEITVASKTVPEGEVAHFKLWLRNVGDENPNWTLEVATKPKKIFIGMKLGTSYLFPASPPSEARAARAAGASLLCVWRTNEARRPCLSRRVRRRLRARAASSPRNVRQSCHSPLNP